MGVTGVRRIEVSESICQSEVAGPPAIEAGGRPTVRGKFLFINGRKLYVRGVTYGTFRALPDGAEYPEPDVVNRDFAAMAAHGVNSVRTYTVPPRWLLDL